MPGVFNAEAYGVKTSAADMIRYVEANIRRRSLEPPMRRAIEGTHVGYFRVGEMVQGLGWEQYPYPVTLDRLLAGNSDAMVMKPNAATELTPPQTPSGPTLFNKTGSTCGLRRLCRFRAREEDRHRHAGEPEFPGPGPHHRSACGARGAGGGSEVARCITSSLGRA